MMQFIDVILGCFTFIFGFLSIAFAFMCVFYDAALDSYQKGHPGEDFLSRWDLFTWAVLFGTVSVLAFGILELPSF